MNRKKSVVLWVVAFVLTLAIASYQRITGPTYPTSGFVVLNGKKVSYMLNRSHGGPGNAPITVLTVDEAASGILEWKRFKTEDAWTPVAMHRNGAALTAELPHQPPAGKLQYRVVLRDGDRSVMIPPREPVVIRFRGDVPWFILIPHVLAMFGAMLLSTRTGLEFFNPQPRIRTLMYWTLGFLFAGGLILGPVVQKYAFDAFWTGWPFGHDLTDNKTAVAFFGWCVAALAYNHVKQPGRWALGAAILLLVVYLIPHSLLGSELDYNESDRNRTGMQSPG